jgi:predicted O-methyltransferase YrrM
MIFQEFFHRFGASARTKNVLQPFRRPLRDILRKRDRPIVSLPRKSGLPKGFIRLCPWEIEFLFACARRAKKGILEIGRFNGGSVFLMACANSEVPIYSIDIKPQNDLLLGQLFEMHDVGENVTLIVGDSQHTTYDNIQTFDLLFIDGDHSYDGCKADLNNWFDKLAVGGYVVFHDSYLGSPVQDVILDFIDSTSNIEVILSPLIGRSYWRYPAGSLACLRKLS